MVFLHYDKRRLLAMQVTTARTCCLLSTAILLAVASAALGQDIELRAPEQGEASKTVKTWL
jgi:hypothetical protein